MNDELTTLRFEPYRMLFPIGYFCLVFGLGIWSVGLLGESTELARIHAILLANGFLFCFSLGILLTEIPTLLRTPQMGMAQLSLLVITLTGMTLAALSQEVFYAQLFHLLSTLNLAVFLGLSLLASGTKGHPGPALIFTGALLSLAGTAIFLLAETFSIPREFGIWGAYIGLHAYFLLFSCACLRWSRADADTRGKSAASDPALWAALALLIISLALEARAGNSAHPETYLRSAYALRAGWLAWFIFRPKGVVTILSRQPQQVFYLRVGLLFVLAGTVLSAVNPGHTVIFNHATFLGGFAWILFSAATGIIMTRSKSIRKQTGFRIAGFGGLMLAAALAFRIAAGFSAGSRTGLLITAACLGLAPVFLWAIVFFPSIADIEDRKEKIV